MARDAVVFPEVVTVAAALMDPALRPLVADGRSLVRRAGQEDHFMAALGDRLGRGWLREVERSDGPGTLQSWMSGLTREMPSLSLSGQAPRQMWWVGAAHRPVEVGVGLRLLATAAPAGEQQREEPAAWKSELWVPRRAGRGAGLKAVSEERFLEGLDHARAYAERYGHLAVPHTGAPHDGFDLGRWPANLRLPACRPSAPSSWRSWTCGGIRPGRSAGSAPGTGPMLTPSPTTQSAAATT